MIKLISDTIEQEDIIAIGDWIKSKPTPRYTKGPLTIEFENEWAKWQGSNYAVFVNSGSSANLLMIYALIESKRLKNKKVVIPSLCWSTTLSPLIQFGLEPLLCDADPENLCVDLNKLEGILIKEDPAALMLVNVLGFTPNMKALKDLSEKYNFIIIEDSCETLGTTFNGKKAGTFGLMSSFSTFHGHHISTIEGGMVCTDDKEIRDLLLMLRSHGWDRDLDKEDADNLRETYNISDFDALYTFYYPSFNLRSTDLHAFLGLRQLKKLDHIVARRHKNFKNLHAQIKNTWKPVPLFFSTDIISNFAYPIIDHRRDDICKILKEHDIEHRPLICGSIDKQPFYQKRGYNQNLDLDFSHRVHIHGLYIPNHEKISSEDINLMASLINEVTA